MRTDDPNDEMTTAIAEAAKVGPRSADRYRAYLAAVLDAQQAHREWAEDELAAIQYEGACARFKKHWKPAAVPVPIGKATVPVQTTVGVYRDGWEQVPVGQLTIPEFNALVDERAGQRNRMTGELQVLRRLQKYVAKHAASLPPDALVNDALAIEAVDVLDVITGVA